MTTLSGLIAANGAVAAEAARVDPEAAVRSAIWPTAGRMIDHLGNIQAWATEVVRTGAPADRKEFRRPDGADRVEWIARTGTALVDELSATDPDRECWTLFEAERVTSFWRRRMRNEAAKHLWDLRTAGPATPAMPGELTLAEQADALDEWVDVFVGEARRRGVDPLPRDVVLVADDVDRAWRFGSDWTVTPAIETDDADVLRADVGDLVLFVWERASPWDLPGRFRLDGPDAALRAFAQTPIHL